MCTRFVYNGSDSITGFNFEIDLAVWDHKVLCEPDRFFIGIRRPDGQYHSYHGVHKSGNAATLLYVHPNSAAQYRAGADCCTIADLAEQYICGVLTFEDALHLVQTKRIVYAPDATMQALLSAPDGRVLLVEPGLGWRAERRRWSLVTNYSLLDPASTRPYITPGDDRFERAQALLERGGPAFSVQDALAVLRAVSQEGPWATRVSFVYSAQEQAVYYVQNNHFEAVQVHRFRPGAAEGGAR